MNKDVVAWNKKIQGESVRTAGGSGGAGAVNLDGRAEMEDPFGDGDDCRETGYSSLLNHHPSSRE